MEMDVSRNIEEQLSAFLDGELPEEELALLVRRLEIDEDHRATLGRFAAIGSALRNDPVEQSAAGLRTHVMQAIGDEEEVIPEEPVSAEGGSSRSYMVAALALVGVCGAYLAGVFEPGIVPLSQQPEVAAQVAASSVPVPSQTIKATPVVAANDDVSLPAAARERVRIKRDRMRSYLISHGEYARPFQGAMANSRIYVQQVSFEE
jgi:negative regulator of sigma E activity